MKINLIPSLLALIVAAALTYLVYWISNGNPGAAAVTIGTAISSVVTLICTFAVQTPNAKVGFNLKALNFTVFVITLAVNLIFAWLAIDTPLYIVVMAILMSITLAGVYKICTTQF